MNKCIIKNKSNNKNNSKTNDKTNNTNDDKFNCMPIDIIHNIYGFLQRTDQIAWKLTSKFYYSKLIHNSMDLNAELNLYTKTISELDYAWKGDTRYINIKEFPPKLAEKYSILNNYAVITDLWYFDFNAEFDVYPGDYRILCLTNVTGYTINIKFTDQADGKITETSYEPVANKIKIKFETRGKIRVNCRETSKVKNLKTIQYIMCIPEYYWRKIKSYKNRHPEWKRQIVMTNEGLEGQKILRYFN
jgi:hypothetical protein